MTPEHVANLIWYAYCDHSEHGDSFDWEQERRDACNALLQVSGVSVGAVCEIINRGERFERLAVEDLNRRLTSGKFRD